MVLSNQLSSVSFSLFNFTKKYCYYIFSLFFKKNIFCGFLIKTLKFPRLNFCLFINMNIFIYSTLDYCYISDIILYI